MSDFVDNSAEVLREIRSRNAQALNAANEYLIDDARGGAPVKSGDLRDGIRVISEAADGNLIAVGASTMPYSRKVNRGDSEREAKPFWTNAWLSMKDRFPSFFRR